MGDRPANPRHMVVLGCAVVFLARAAGVARAGEAQSVEVHNGYAYIGEDLIGRRQICVLWQLGGLRWYDLYGTRTPGNPGRIVLHKGRLIIPNGYEGLWIERRARYMALRDSVARRDGDTAGGGCATRR